MRYIIRTISPKRPRGRVTDYWLPGPRGFTRTGNIDEARARAWATHAEALTYLKTYTTPGAQDEIIEVP
jgi:hypothetical protein